MSKVGRVSIVTPEEVTVGVKNGKVTVSGPKGTLSIPLGKGISIEVEQREIAVKGGSDSRTSRRLWGLTRSLLFNMIKGVSEGFEKSLELVGVGYRAKKEGEELILSVGHSRPTRISPPKGITLSLEGDTVIKVSGIDKQKVGEVAAKIRSIRPPEPYKGKGIRYSGEGIRKKVGKAGKVGAAFGGKQHGFGGEG